MKKLLLILLCFYHFSFAQESTINASFYLWFDTIVGVENLDINSGPLFQKRHNTLRGNHQFLLDDHFHKNALVFNHQEYYNVPLKYDVFNDQLIANIASELENYSIILPKLSIKSFSIENKHFIHSKKYGFLEILYKKDTTFLYKKNHKKRKEKKDRSIAYNQFLKENYYILFIDHQFYRLEKKKDWILIFPNKKSLIKNFYTSNHDILKKNPDKFMVNLLKLIN